jgi:hypothetical protein
MIEHDPVRLHKMERLTSTTAADGTSSAYRDTAPHQAVGGTTMLVGPVINGKFGLGAASGS